MIFTHPIFDEQFEFFESKANVLVIENKDFLKKIVLDIFNLCDGEDSETSFFDKNKELKKEVDIVTDIFSLDVNSTKNLTKLYAKIKEDYIIGEKYQTYLEFSRQAHLFLNDISKYLEYSVEFKENLDIPAFLKLNSMKFSFEDSTVLEKIIDYIDILTEFIGVKVFVFVNLRNYLTDDETESLYKHIVLNKVNILFIESAEFIMLKELENRRIIDKDLCVII